MIAELIGLLGYAVILLIAFTAGKQAGRDDD